MIAPEPPAPAPAPVPESPPEPAPAPTVPAQVSGEYALAASAFGTPIAAASEASLIDRDTRLSALQDLFRDAPGRIAVARDGVAAAHPIEVRADPVFTAVLPVRIDDKVVEIGNGGSMHSLRTSDADWHEAMTSALERFLQYQVLEEAVISGDASLPRVIEVFDLLHAAGVKRVILTDKVRFGGSATPVDRTAVEPAAIRLDQPTSRGDLDPFIIRRYVVRKLPEVQKCAASRAAATPAAFSVDFVILHTGKVVSSKPSVVDPLTECAASVFGTIYFPKPRGGGTVEVSLPLLVTAPAQP